MAAVDERWRLPVLVTRIATKMEERKVSRPLLAVAIRPTSQVLRRSSFQNLSQLGKAPADSFDWANDLTSARLALL